MPSSIAHPRSRRAWSRNSCFSTLPVALRGSISTRTSCSGVFCLANLAADLLSSGSAGQTRELVIISNFQRCNWANVDFSPLPKDTRIQLESVAPAETPAIVVTPEWDGRLLVVRLTGKLHKLDYQAFTPFVEQAAAIR